MLPHAYDRDVVIHVGELHTAAQPTSIRTLLGSCIAVCLFDSKARVGGMNHFLLPDGDPKDGGDAKRFGVASMEALIYQLQRLGADRARMVGKLFGGAHVLAMPDTPDSVSRRNIRFIQEFMEFERIGVVCADLGGTTPRQVVFHTDRGAVFVKRIQPTTEQMRAEAKRLAEARAKRVYGEVELF